MPTPGPRLNPLGLSPLGRALLPMIATQGYDSLRAFAVHHGLAYVHLHRLVRGRQEPSVATLRRIAGAVGCEVGELIGA